MFIVRRNLKEAGRPVYLQSEIFSPLAFVLGRTERKFISEPMGRHGKKMEVCKRERELIIPLAPLTGNFFLL